MIPLTLAEISKSIGAQIKNVDSSLKITGKVCLNSKAVSTGDLFIAINGEKVDGHDFCQEAIKNGAVAALVSREIPNIAQLVVNDGAPNSKDVDQPTVIALGKLASYLLSKLPNIWKIAVTGSSGKTTTKDLLADLGKLIGPTISPTGSYNNEIGLPQTVLECDDKTKVLILEMGARQVGNIDKLCTIAKPDTSIILNIGTAHAGIFETEDKILNTKSEIIRCLNKNDVAVLNKEDKTFSQQKTNARVVSFGLVGADVCAKNISLNANAQAQFDLEYKGKVSKVELKLVGAHQVSNSLAAAAVFLDKGIEIDQVTKVLSNSIAKSKWRMQVEVSSKNITVINDSYNSNPESMKSALKTLKHIGEDKNTFVIMGEMLELGEKSKEYHEDIAKLIHQLGIKNCLIVGQGARPVFNYLQNQGFNGNVIFTENLDETLLNAKKMINPNDVVLVKASRSIGLERVANAIVSDFSDNLSNIKNQEVGP